MQHLDSAHSMELELVAVHWNAPWSQQCEASAAHFNTLAEMRPDVMFLRLEVEASDENTSFAFEKVRPLMS